MKQKVAHNCYGLYICHHNKNKVINNNHMSYTNQKKSIQVLISKKGTKVVIASHLHRALRIPMFKFNRNISRWVKGVYAFEDDMRNPIEFKDYGERKFEIGKQKDYYLSLELARLICLQSEADKLTVFTCRRCTHIIHKRTRIVSNLVPVLLQRGVSINLWRTT